MVDCNYSTAAGREEPLGEKKAQSLTGLILAGGAGQRVGNRDKGLLSWRGAPLIEHVRERLNGQVGTVLISCNRNAGVYAGYADQVVSDCRPGFQGPLAGIESAAGLVSSPMLLVVPCDTPLLPIDLGRRLVAALQASPRADIAHARCGGRNHYLCAALRTECLTRLGEFMDGGGRAVRDWFAAQQAVCVDFNDPLAFLNINTGTGDQP